MSLRHCLGGRRPEGHSVESGYKGGDIDNPTYQQVCTGKNAHVEVLRITFDPNEMSYRDLLDVFFASHDPTALNRQGNDVGTQNRSVIFNESEEQRRQASEAIAELNAKHVWPKPVATAVELASKFFVPVTGVSSSGT